MGRHLVRLAVGVSMTAVLWSASLLLAQHGSADGEVAGAVEGLRLADLADRIERLEKGRVARLESRQAAVERVVANVQFEAGVVALERVSRVGGRPSPRQSGRYVQRGILGGRVKFEEPFAVVPAVHMGLSQLDVWAGANVRIVVRVTAVDENGFDYEFFSWSNTHVYEATAAWMAVAK